MIRSIVAGTLAGIALGLVATPALGALATLLARRLARKGSSSHA
jgi:hypothetical protein